MPTLCSMSALLCVRPAERVSLTTTDALLCAVVLAARLTRQTVSLSSCRRSVRRSGDLLTSYRWLLASATSVVTGVEDADARRPTRRPRSSRFHRTPLASRLPSSQPGSRTASRSVAQSCAWFFDVRRPTARSMFWMAIAMIGYAVSIVSTSRPVLYGMSCPCRLSRPG